MPRYIAFLRAINVGGHTVKMDYLRTLFEALGFTSVETFIASGNVIFDSSARRTRALEKKIEASLQLTLGYAVATFIRSTSELNEIARYQPFPEAELDTAGNRLYVGFMAGVPSDAATQQLLGLKMTTDSFHLNGREVYWLCRTSFSDSEFSGARLEKMLGLPVTLRNSTTVNKLVAKYP
ncbi:MAG: DUF1697 domain-containing protein [Acidobacteriota bacterium]